MADPGQENMGDGWARNWGRQSLRSMHLGTHDLWTLEHPGKTKARLNLTLRLPDHHGAHLEPSSGCLLECARDPFEGGLGVSDNGRSNASGNAASIEKLTGGLYRRNWTGRGSRHRRSVCWYPDPCHWQRRSLTNGQAQTGDVKPIPCRRRKPPIAARLIKVAAQHAE